jgi:DNA-3-methyladenine glycosylase I
MSPSRRSVTRSSGKQVSASKPRKAVAKKTTARKPKPRVGESAPALAKAERCFWAATDPLLGSYHDEEWGVPVHDDRHWFEKLILDGAQAGLSWLTILRKRDAYREAYLNFDPKKVARFDARDEARLLANAGIVRNGAKIRSSVRNARAFLEIQAEHGSFDAYIWKFVEGKPLQPKPSHRGQIPARTELSDRISADLKKRGFSFVGSTIVYAFMQAAGLVNDHTTDCFRHAHVARLK